MRRGTNVVFRDLVFLALAGFIAVTIILLSHIHPEGRKQLGEVIPPGNVMVEIRWPDEMQTDVDLWVQAPKDTPVGYSNLNGRFFNLLRDDLGGLADPLGLNYENAYTRGVPLGEYTVNVHLFSNREAIYPVPVDVQVSSRVPPAGTRKLLHSQVMLKFPGQEITVFRFVLQPDGSIVPDTLHSNYKRLRSMR